MNFLELSKLTVTKKKENLKVEAGDSPDFIYVLYQKFDKLWIAFLRNFTFEFIPDLKCHDSIVSRDLLCWALFAAAPIRMRLILKSGLQSQAPKIHKRPHKCRVQYNSSVRFPTKSVQSACSKVLFIRVQDLFELPFINGFVSHVGKRDKQKKWHIGFMTGFCAYLEVHGTVIASGASGQM